MSDAHAERRARLHLPEPDAEHECRATAGEKEHPCYGGQWTLHGPHDYEVIRANWRGGGKAQIHCPGKTPATLLGARAGGC